VPGQVKHVWILLEGSPLAVASSARVLAQVGEASEALTRVREGEQLLEHQAARECVGFRGTAYNSLGRAAY
jgi:hypothetical protein